MSFGDTWDVLQLPIKAKISRIQVEWPDRPLYWVGLSAMQIQNIGAQLVRWRDNKVRRIIYSDYGEIKLAYREDTITTRVYSQTSISEERDAIDLSYRLIRALGAVEGDYISIVGYKAVVPGGYKAI